MRVIAGIAKGKKLKTFNGKQIRPTTDRIKEAIFSIIQFDITQKKFLDLFSGSGQIGIEAISRGALQSVFVDCHKDAIDIIRDNIKNLDFEDRSKVINMDAYSFLNKTQEIFDIAFLDPPYNKDDLKKILPELAKVMSFTGIIICETTKGVNLPEYIMNFKIYKIYQYGKISINVYRVLDVL